MINQKKTNFKVGRLIGEVRDLNGIYQINAKAATLNY